MQGRVAPSKTAGRTGRDAGTRGRLLVAAIGAFAEHGYRDASLREICGRAGANNAAVNYHFGSKGGLHHEVLREAFRRIQRERPLPAPAGPPRDATEARERLRAVVASVAAGLLEPKLRPHEVVLLREMIAPIAPLDDIVEEFVRPRFRAIAQALAPFCDGASEREVTLRALGALGEVLYHRWCGPVALRLLGEPSYGPRLVDEIVDAVVGAAERAASPRP